MFGMFGLLLIDGGLSDFNNCGSSYIDNYQYMLRELESRRKRLEAEETRKKQLVAQQQSKNLRYQGSAYSYFQTMIEQDERGVVPMINIEV